MTLKSIQTSSRVSICILFLLSACAVNPYRKTNRIYHKHSKELAKQLLSRPEADSLPPKYWAGTTNFNLRKPNFVVIHHTAQQSCDQTLRTFTLQRTQVSAHYVICKDGTVHHMLHDGFRAWHGGVGSWGNLTDLNSASIGIELDNNGSEPFPSPQLNSLLRVLDTLKRKHQIPTANFIGHADIAPVRKVDPNVYFPWKLLADRGFGNWFPDTTGMVLPENFDAMRAMRLIGYNITDTVSAIGAFKRHYIQDTVRVLNDADRKILYSLSEKIFRQQ